MTADPFQDRLTRVRDRFATSLTAKIDDTCAAIPHLSALDPGAAATVEDAFRSVHGMVGVGPTVGFPATGQAARDVADVLRQPRQDKRGLTADEISRLTKTLQTLREAAARELRSFGSVQQ